ncbi:hypothetical protein [Paludibacterium sp. B53371]|uniref:hypothetical protein n=1 Tax=Paludibacterium sp. B53371 TaxID=2806263 RepID=UPI001C03FE8B|nr:hypothetical protein [Paludibacterium sp. B53371]
MKRYALFVVLALLAGRIFAAEPGYRLDCLPDNAPPGLADNIRMRLDLHGWREVKQGSDYQLCFRLEERQQIITEPGPAYGPYWAPPVSRVVRIPVLVLRAGSHTQPGWQGRQDLDGDVDMEEAVRRLIDQLPL